jgi:hypothetical protein
MAPRPGVALASCLSAAGLSLAIAAACGGPAFVGAPADGGAGVIPVPDGGSFCALEAGTHTFCDDFDGPPLASRWSTIDRSSSTPGVAGGAGVPAGTAQTDSSESYSTPSSFESAAPAALGETRGRIDEIFGSASKVVVAFELSVDSAPAKLTGTATGVSGDALVGVSVGTGYTVGLSAHQDLGYFEDLASDGGTTGQDNLIVTPKGWTPVVLTVDVANAKLSLTVGGQPLLSGKPITPPSSGAITVSLGAYQHNEATPLAAHFDNVTIDLTP